MRAILGQHTEPVVPAGGLLGRASVSSGPLWASSLNLILRPIALACWTRPVAARSACSGDVTARKSSSPLPPVSTAAWALPGDHCPLLSSSAGLPSGEGSAEAWGYSCPLCTLGAVLDGAAPPPTLPSLMCKATGHGCRSEVDRGGSGGGGAMLCVTMPVTDRHRFEGYEPYSSLLCR